jgi:hypothetical protein
MLWCGLAVFALTVSLQPLAANASGVAAAGTGFSRAVPITAPGNAAADPDEGLYGVACPGHGDCVTGGAYTDVHGNGDAMVVTQARGRWARAVEVRLPANAAADPSAEVNGVACPSQGNCVAVGYYSTTSDHDEGFIVTQSRGAWARALEAQPPKNAGSNVALLEAVACTGPGACQAVGYYEDTAKQGEGLVIPEVAGRWRRGSELRTASDFPAYAGPTVTGIACARAGYCTAVGFYYTSDTLPYTTGAVAYVEARGKWGEAVKVRAPSNAKPEETGLDEVACVAKACLAVGSYELSAAASSAMVASESGGRWHQATEITARPAHATGAGLDGISCATNTLCLGAGGYGTAAHDDLALLETWSRGKWGSAGGVSLPANGLTSAPRDYLFAVGCAADGYCAAVGYYLAKNHDYYAMAVPRP